MPVISKVPAKGSLMNVRTIFFVAFLFLTTSPSYASVVGEPQCTMNVSIVSQKYGELRGKLSEVNSTITNRPYCYKFKNKDVLITAKSGVYHRIHNGILERMESLTIGVQEFSSMGSDGPVKGRHFETIEMVVDGKKLSGPGNVPFFEIQIVE